MRAALWLLALFGFAAATALFAGNNNATVTLFWYPNRIDVSLNLVLIALALLFALIYIAIRTVLMLFALPTLARRWRDLQKERASRVALVSAQTNYLAGRYTRAQKAALSAIKTDRSRASSIFKSKKLKASESEFRALAHVVAAQSGHALQDKPSRDEHLTSAYSESLNLDTQDGIQMLAASCALEDRDARTALDKLSQLSTGAVRRTLALKLKLKALQLDNLSADALTTIRLLAKHNAVSKDIAASMIKSLILKQIQEANTLSQLHMVWADLNPLERTQIDISISASNKLQKLDGKFQQVSEWLLPAWQFVTTQETGIPDLDKSRRSELIETLEHLVSTQEKAWLANVEKAQLLNPRDPNLLYIAGIACKSNSLWGKAQQQLSQAIPLLRDDSTKRKALCAIAELAEQREDQAAADVAWKKAALLNL